MAKIKYVQLEPAAFLADFVGLTPAQRGAYTTICFKLYDGAINADPKSLAVLCATAFEDFQNEIWPAISHKFSVSDNLLTHKRVTKELKIAREHHKKRQNAAKKRWSKADAKHKQSYANQNQNQNQKDNSNQKKKPKPQPSKEVYISIFDQARNKFYGIKRGLQTEYDNFRKKHKDWEKILPLLLPAIENQIINRERLRLKNTFVPPPKNFKTWINNRCWEEIMPERPKIPKPLCACGCGKEGHNIVNNQSFYTSECRKKVLGW